MSMTVYEAIHRIKDHMAVHHIGQGRHIYIKEALDMAIDALREQEGRWIPVTEQLPKTDGRFMVTIKGRSGKPHVEMRNFHAGAQKWESQCGWMADENIMAWQQRPRPYGWKPRKPEKEK